MSDSSEDSVNSKPVDNTVAYAYAALGFMGGGVGLWLIVKFVNFISGSNTVVSNTKPK